MIPVEAADVDALIAEIDRQDAEIGSLVEGLEASALGWRPDPTRWSLVEHVEHLNIVNTAYLGSLESTIRDARGRGGQESDGPYRHPFLARRFARMMEPPPGMRMKTARAMKPAQDLDPSTTLGAFSGQQKKLADIIEEARGLDLGRIRFGSPFLALLRLSLGTGFEVLLAHNRRHLWLIREVLAHDDFPGGAHGAG